MSSPGFLPRHLGMTRLFLVAAFFAAVAARADVANDGVVVATNAWSVDFGADLRVRQEFVDHVPGLPGGGVQSRAVAGDYRNHMRFRPRVWGEIRAFERWRLFTRLTDEFRWNVQPKVTSNTFPDEMVVDNLFVEGTGLFDGFLDISLGRQDLYNLYGLDHVFVDGTPGDGSRTVFSDLVRVALRFTETERLDMFFLHNADDNVLRWGTDRSKHRSLTGLGGGAEPDMDDWGWGGVFSTRLGDGLALQLFALQKITESYSRGGVKHPWTRRETLGFKAMPKLTDTITLQFEGMGQVGRNGDGDWLSGWSAYAGGRWQSASAGVKPFASAGLHLMSGDDDAASEDGGHRAWDPLWSRGVNDSELFLYGTHYGAAWWSNMIFLKLAGGIKFGDRHDLTVSSGPMFAACRDELGGGDGAFKGLLSQAKYSFPILLADREKGERLEVFGHVLAELFNPGDYFETDRAGWFLRWQVEIRF